MQLLDGKKISQKIKAEIKLKIDQIIKEQKRIPKLVVIIVGEDYASHLYVKNKIKACENVGIKGEIIHFSDSVSEPEIIETIEKLNQDNDIDGILVQLPLVKSLNEFKILNTIAVAKDVDGLTSISAGKLLQGDTSAIIPCTARGIIALLEAYNLECNGKDVVIINNSNIVGKPLAMMLNNMGATVSLTHKATKDLKFYLKNADIIVTATGVYQLFTSQDVKDSVIIIDVAINNNKDKKLVGDVEFETFKNKAQAITPVPGGVGPMTIAMLLENLMKLYQAK